MKFASALLLGTAWLHAAVIFEPNRGQSDARMAFVARTANGAVGLNADRLEFRRRDGARASIRLLGARKYAQGAGEELLPGVNHYVLGTDPGRWIWSVPRYSRLRFPGVYPGIDVAYHSGNGEVEFDFLLSPGADATRIGLAFSDPVRLSASGELVSGATILRPPRAWQTVQGKRVPVQAAFTLRGGKYAGVRLGVYERSLPLTIDPTVVFATYLGGSADEADSKIVSGTDGAIYLAGTTWSVDFPAALPADNILNRPEILLSSDVYVSRMNKDGSALDWSLFIGGNSQETVAGLRRDELGNLYLLGTTTSPNFPVTTGAYRSKIHPFLSDLFVVKLDAQTGRIKTSTFLGVASQAARLAVDSAGGVYVAGSESDAAFQTTPGAYLPNSATLDPTRNGYANGFVLRMNAAVNAVVYATLFDVGSIKAMDVDAGGNLVLGGVSASFLPYGWPAFAPVNPIPGVSQNEVGRAFVAKLNATGTALIFATLLHGGGISNLSDLKLATDGTIHLLGYAGGSQYPQVNPLTLDPLPANYPPPGDPTPFWAKLPPGGGALIQSTLLYGPQFNTAPSLAYPFELRLLLPPSGPPCLLNVGASTLQQTPGGLVGKSPSYPYPLYGGTLVCVNEAGTGLGVKTMLPAYATYPEGTAASDGTLLFAGTAQSGFVTTPGSVQPGFAGGSNSGAYTDALLLRLSFNNPLPKVQSVVPDSIVLQTSATGTFGVEVYGSGFAYGMDTTFNGKPVSSTFVDSGHISLANISYDACQAGSDPIALSLPSPGGGSSEGALTCVNATPNGTSVSPATVTQGSGDAKVVIRAANLGKDSTLYWNGAARAAQYVADSFGRGGHFELVLGASETAQPSVSRVSVGNPAPGGGVSAEVFFAVQPASSAALPTVAAATQPIVVGGTVPVVQKVALNGTGFTSSTLAYWDGIAVPLELVSATRINIVPPSSDLTHWGAHDVYVANGVYRSPTVRQLIARSASVGFSVADPVQQRLYVTTAVNYPYTAPADLLIFDLRTGNLLTTVSGIASAVLALTVSTDGRYVYVGSGTTEGKISRYDTIAGAVDLEWPVEIPPNSYYAATLLLLPIPGSPEGLIAWNPVVGVTLFDRDRPRYTTSLGAGFAAGDMPIFATASRIYLSQSTSYCWRWMDFDAVGIAGGSLACSTELPPEAVRDGGFLYLADGSRTYVIAAPAPALVGGPALATFLADPSRRRAEQLAGVSSVILTEYNLDSRQQVTRAQFLSGSYGTSLLLGADGALVIVTANWIGVLP